MKFEIRGLIVVRVTFHHSSS